MVFDDGWVCVYYNWITCTVLLVVDLSFTSPGGPFTFRVAPTSSVCFTPKSRLHARRPGSNKRYIACMQEQPVRVIVRLPYNRPEHRQSDPVPVSPPDNQRSNQGPMYVLSLGVMELGERELPLGSCSEISWF
jgi:hypothetical protein